MQSTELIGLESPVPFRALGVDIYSSEWTERRRHTFNERLRAQRLRAQRLRETGASGFSDTQAHSEPGA